MSSCGVVKGGRPPVVPGRLPRDEIRQRELIERHLAAEAAAAAAVKANSPKNRRSRRRQIHAGGSGLEAAIVPFGLLAVQQWFGTRNVKSSKNNKQKSNKNKSMKQKSNKNKTRKNRK